MASYRSWSVNIIALFTAKEIEMRVGMYEFKLKENI